MPSHHDAPSSSQLLISRHDASSRQLDHGLAEGVNEEADEPPNIARTRTDTEGDNAGSEAAQPQPEQHEPDSSGNEGDEDASDAEASRADRFLAGGAKQQLALTAAVSKVGRTRSSSSASPHGSAQLRRVDVSLDSTDTSSGDDAASEGSDSGSVSPSPSDCSAAGSPAPPLHLTSLLPLPPSTASTGYALPAGYDPSHPTESLPPAGQAVSYVSPQLEARVSHTGSGIFAVRAVSRGDVLIVWTGRICTAEQTLSLMSTADKHYILQVGDGFYQTPLQALREPADWTNHSCSPNAGFGLQSPVCLSAMRDIAAGEEVTFDYGMCETDERLWEPMECQCGSEQCRRWITANDWKRPELWQRYAGFFSPHVQRRIDQYREELLSQEAAEEKAKAPSAAAEVTAVTAAQHLAASDAEVKSASVSVRLAAAAAAGGWLDRLLFALGLVRVSQLQSQGVSVQVE